MVRGGTIDEKMTVPSPLSCVIIRKLMEFSLWQMQKARLALTLLDPYLLMVKGD